MEETRPLRADALRNRQQLLQVAYETFATEGLSVPIDEIARRAGVGAGTVYRHFPTKEALFAAIAADRVAEHVAHAHELAEQLPPGPAFFAFLDWTAGQAGADQGLMEALAGTGFDLATVVPEAERDWLAAFEELLTAAQRDGSVRADLDVADIKALLLGYQAMLRYRADPAATERLTAMIHAGLQPPRAE
jgi:AcrR family transcriptional regulator